IGGRYNDEKRTSANPSFVVARNGLGPILITTTEGTSVSRTFEDFTPTFGIEWRPGGDRGSLLYVTAAEGFKAGAGENAAGSTIIVDPETVENIEVGFKTTLLDGNLALNVAAFAYELEGQQDDQRRPGRLQHDLRERRRDVGRRCGDRALRADHRPVQAQHVDRLSRLAVRRLPDIRSAEPPQRADARPARF